MLTLQFINVKQTAPQNKKEKFVLIKLLVPFGIHQLVELPTVWLYHAFTARQYVDFTWKRGIDTWKWSFCMICTILFNMLHMSQWLTFVLEDTNECSNTVSPCSACATGVRGLKEKRQQVGKTRKEERRQEDTTGEEKSDKKTWRWEENECS